MEIDVPELAAIVATDGVNHLLTLALVPFLHMQIVDPVAFGRDDAQIHHVGFRNIEFRDGFRPCRRRCDGFVPFRDDEEAPQGGFGQVDALEIGARRRFLGELSDRGFDASPVAFVARREGADAIARSRSGRSESFGDGGFHAHDDAFVRERFVEHGI